VIDIVVSDRIRTNASSNRQFEANLKRKRAIRSGIDFAGMALPSVEFTLAIVDLHVIDCG